MRRRLSPSQSGLLPADAARPWIVAALAALTLLCCLSLPVAVAAMRAADGWRQTLAGEATVQVRPRVGETGAEAGARAAQALGAIEGVEEVEVLPREAAEQLLAPWVGESVADDMPLPWLVTVRLDRRAPASAVSLSRALAGAGVDADVDDHLLWRTQADRAATAVYGLMIGLAGLTLAALCALAWGWTRAGVASHRDLIRSFARLGATDARIVGLFQARYGAGVLAGGGLGAAAAILVLASLRLLGGVEGVVPALPLRWSDLLLVSPAPVLAATVTLVAARYAALAAARGGV